jgi:hypothetical protein
VFERENKTTSNWDPTTTYSRTCPELRGIPYRIPFKNERKIQKLK